MDRAVSVQGSSPTRGRSTDEPCAGSGRPRRGAGVARGFLVNVMATVALLLLATATVRADERTSPDAVVARFHAALASGERSAALDLLHPHVVIFESGRAELSREQYASRRLGADIALAARTERRSIEQRQGGSGDSAWVITRYEIAGTFRNQPVSCSTTETMMLTRTPQGWKIAHAHWSSHPKEAVGGGIDDQAQGCP